MFGWGRMFSGGDGMIALLGRSSWIGRPNLGAQAGETRVGCFWHSNGYM